MYNMNQNTKVRFFETGFWTYTGSGKLIFEKLMLYSHSPSSKTPKYKFLGKNKIKNFFLEKRGNERHYYPKYADNEKKRYYTLIFLT
jgi:hypothetical protein